ncbi:MAG: non-canonical purine NTP pyrophosphatase [Acidimicrobiia bacterium]
MTTAFVLATGNADKVREITEILSDAFAQELRTEPILADGATASLVSDAGATGIPSVSVTHTLNVEETGGTLVANARIKAAAWCAATGLPAIADDTGLFVDALDGAPGVDTAYFAGPTATYAENVAKLLRVLDGVPDELRGAYFATSAIAVFPDGHEVVVEGRATGSIARSTAGDTGFGFDPVFIPDDGGGRRFAEMSMEEKHLRSHRGRAFRALAARLVDDGCGAGVLGRSA